MSLTPEERARIHEEERERFQAQKHIRSEARFKLFRNIMTGVGVLMAVVVLMAVGSLYQEKTAVVIDDSMWLSDGQAKSYKLDPGTYRVEMTSSGDGATVECIGSGSPRCGETSSYSQVIEMKRTGQVLITNPTVFGTGASASVTIKVTKLPSAP